MTAFDILSALMLSNCGAKGSVMAAKQTPRCALVQRNTFQTCFATIIEKLPIVRIIFKDSEIFQKTFNVVTVHNLIFLGEIWQEIFMTFPVKDDERTRFLKIFFFKPPAQKTP